MKRLERQQEADAVNSKEDLQAVTDAAGRMKRGTPTATPTKDHPVDEDELVKHEELLDDEEEEAADDAATNAE